MSDEKSQDREALELLVDAILINTRDYEARSLSQLQFVVGNIREAAERVATLRKIDDVT